MKDKNGKEILEGDIIRTEWNMEIVEEYVESDGKKLFIELQGQKVSLDCFSSDGIEVIGSEL